MQISAWDEGNSWEQGLLLLESNSVNANAAIRACERSGHWLQAYDFFGQLRWYVNEAVNLSKVPTVVRSTHFWLYLRDLQISSRLLEGRMVSLGGSRNSWSSGQAFKLFHESKKSTRSCLPFTKPQGGDQTGKWHKEPTNRTRMISCERVIV